MGFIYNLKKVYWEMRKLAGKADAGYNRFYTQRIHFPNTYRKYSSAPVDEDKVVFVEVSHPKLTNSFQVMFDELTQKYNYKVHCHFLRRDYVPRSEYNKRVCEMLQDVATAKYVFTNDACSALSCVPLRKETYITQLWHGCGAFKKFGFGTADLIFGASRRDLLKYPNYKNQSLVTVSSPEVEWAYVEAMGLEDQKEIVKGIGCSRSDVFYDPAFIEAAHEKLYTLMPQARGKKVILYAPTFRGRVAKAKTPNLLSVKMFNDELGEDYVLIFKHHPFVRKPPAVPAAYEKFAADFTNAMSIEELLCVSDVCISDYSSLIFEYSIFEKPLIFFSYDLSEYFDWRGFFYDYSELTPGPVFTTNREMIDYIKNIDTRFDKQKVIDFRNRFMSACDGHSTEKIMNEMFGKESLDRHLKPEAEWVDVPLWSIPNGFEMYSVHTKRIERLKQMSETADAIYQKNCQGPVEEKLVIFLGASMTDAMSSLKKSMTKEGSFRIETLKGTDDWKTDAAKLAAAGAVIVEGTCDLLNCLTVRPETKVVQLSEQTMPVNRSGYASMRYKAGLDADYVQYAPLHKNYTCIPVGSAFAAECYSEVYGRENSEDLFRPIGTVASDVLFNGKMRKQARAFIEKWFPQAAGKKIIYYHPEIRTNPFAQADKPMLPDGLYLHEYLKDDYVVIYSYPTEGEIKTNISAYYGDVILNLQNPKKKAEAGYRMLSHAECLVAADLVIADFNMEDLECLTVETPILFYAPDHVVHTQTPDSFLDYEKLTEGLLYTDTCSMMEQIVHMDTYPVERLKALREKYFAYCDGKAAGRLMEYLKERK